MASDAGSRRGPTEMQRDVIFALSDGPKVRTRLAGLTNIHWNKLVDEILPALIAKGLVKNLDNDEVCLTAAGIAELKILKSSKLVVKSEAGGA